ncbi:MAG: hypothetical protein M0019_04175 [Actinomycetota bacterium]|nr:hypothetical protein [Actinomycetota bacterium]
MNELELYLDQVDLALEGAVRWPVPPSLVGLSIDVRDRNLKERLLALLKRNHQAEIRVEQRKKDLSILIKRASKRDGGPIAVDIRA